MLDRVPPSAPKEVELPVKIIRKRSLPTRELDELRVAIERNRKMTSSSAVDGLFSIVDLLLGGWGDSSGPRYRVNVRRISDGGSLWVSGDYENFLPVELFERVCEVLERDGLGPEPDRVRPALEAARDELFRR